MDSNSGKTINGGYWFQGMTQTNKSNVRDIIEHIKRTKEQAVAGWRTR